MTARTREAPHMIKKVTRTSQGRNMLQEKAAWQLLLLWEERPPVAGLPTPIPLSLQPLWEERAHQTGLLRGKHQQYHGTEARGIGMSADFQNE